MKKIYLALTVAAASLISSCDMDLAPVGSLDDGNAIESVTDLMKARNGIYENLRSIATGGYVFYTDIQMDQFMGLTINGNQNGQFAHGNINSSISDIEGVWANCYSYIANANYLLGHADHVTANPDLDSDDLLEAKRYVAETRFARAYYYYYLFDHFCETYSPALGDVAAKGLPLVTVFNPTGDIAAYSGRSTMNETFKLIDDDLAAAYTDLKAYETETSYAVAPMAAYVNSYTVLALQARLALLRQDWKTAVAKANEVINSGIYTLADVDSYAAMWAQDASDELIFRPISTRTERGISSTGGAYIDGNPEMAYYVPTLGGALTTYVNGDVRFDAFFGIRSLRANGITYPAYVFNKYPGNTELNSGSNNDLMNMGKPFRLSETYLILAEAACEDGDLSTAGKALNDIRAARIAGYEEEIFSNADILRQQIREERTKELIGEGFRMSDLRRWNLGFKRDATYVQGSSLPEIFVTVDTQVEYTAGDYRYVWPIPNTEMENNPQLKGQQNPGY